MRLSSVQYLRGMAALFVVAFHAANNMGAAAPHFAILSFGEYGVDLFFVISGFIMMATTENKSSPKDFVRKRIIRIVPLYWLTTIIFVAVNLVRPGLLRSGTNDLSFISLSFLFVPSYHPHFPTEIWPVIIPGWSLNFEMFFYMLFALALFISSRQRGLLVILFLGLFVTLGQIVASSNAIFLTYTNTLLLEFIFGMLIGKIFLSSNLAATRTILVLFFVLSAIAIWFNLLGLIVWRSVLYGSVSGCLLSILVYLEQRGMKFSNATIIAIGDASYSIYLTHGAVIASLRWIGNGLALEGNNLAVGLGMLTIASGVSSILGWLIFVIFERPITVWLNSLFGSTFRAHGSPLR